MTGDPELFNGTIALTPNQVTSVINKVPVWAWVLVALVALFVGHQYFYKGKKII